MMEVPSAVAALFVPKVANPVIYRVCFRTASADMKYGTA
jgi:hypothetical protein